MALMICPHCGKRVSDTAEICVHCGKNIMGERGRGSEQPFIEYTRLSIGRQKDLTKEFHALFPEQADADRKRISQIIRLSLILVFGLLIFACFSVWYFTDEDSTASFVSIVLACVLVIAEIGVIITELAKRKYVDRSVVKYWKIQTLWLRECKHINCVAVFDGKRRLAFDNEKVSERDLKKIAELKAAENNRQVL